MVYKLCHNFYKMKRLLILTLVYKAFVLALKNVEKKYLYITTPQ